MYILHTVHRTYAGVSRNRVFLRKLFVPAHRLGKKPRFFSRSP